MNVDSVDVDRTLEGILLGLILAWGSFVVVESIQYEPFYAWLFPIIVSVPLVLIVVIQLSSWYSDRIRQLLNRVKLDQSVNIANVDQPLSVWETSLFIVTTILYITVAILVGFFYAMPVYLYTYFRLYDCYTPARAVALTLVIWFVISFLFGTLFSVPSVEFGPFSRIEIGILVIG